MRIGHNNNSLTVEKIGKDLGPLWRVEAMVIGAGWMFAAMHDRLLVNTTAQSAEEIAGFVGLRTRHFELELAEGGWLRLKRDPRGHILIRYRICRLEAGAALEGEVVLEGDSADSFCSQLSALL